jgi:hypothetical protein
LFLSGQKTRLQYPCFCPDKNALAGSAFLSGLVRASGSVEGWIRGRTPEMLRKAC